LSASTLLLLLLLVLVLVPLLIALLVKSDAKAMVCVIGVVLQPSGRPRSFRGTFCISFTLLLAVLPKFSASAGPLPLF
jgi:hypothetical protein